MRWQEMRTEVRRFILLVATILAFSASACNSRCRFIRSEQADFLMIRGEYAIVALHPEFAQKILGPDWTSQTLFYRSTYGLDQDGVKAHFSAGLLRPIAKGSILLMCSGDDWSHQLFAIYSLEKRQFVGLRVDLQKGTIQADPPSKPLYNRTPTVLDDGRLLLHDPSPPNSK